MGLGCFEKSPRQSCSFVLTAMEAAFTRPGQGLARYNSSKDKREDHEVPPVVEGCWKRDSIIFRVNFLRHYSSSCPYIHAQLLGKKRERGGRERERDRNKETEIFSLQNSEKFISLLKDSHPTEACYSH